MTHIKKRELPTLLTLCLLAGCTAAPAAETVTSTPAVESAVLTPAPTPEPTRNPAFAWTGDYHEMDRHATLTDFDHVPLDTLPQELLDSLELVTDMDKEGCYLSEWEVYRVYSAPGLELCTTAPTAAYLEYKAEVDKDNRDIYPAEADFWADIEGEKGREWLVSVTVSSGDYATLCGLKVGMTAEEAEAVGYPVRERLNYTAGVGHILDLSMEDGVITQMRATWGLGRYIGKFFEL